MPTYADPCRPCRPMPARPQASGRFIGGGLCASSTPWNGEEEVSSSSMNAEASASMSCSMWSNSAMVTLAYRRRKSAEVICGFYSRCAAQSWRMQDGLSGFNRPAWRARFRRSATCSARRSMPFTHSVSPAETFGFSIGDAMMRECNNLYAALLYCCRLRPFLFNDPTA